jgi:hypothetical protein
LRLIARNCSLFVLESVNRQTFDAAEPVGLIPLRNSTNSWNSAADSGEKSRRKYSPTPG